MQKRIVAAILAGILFLIVALPLTSCDKRSADEIYSDANQYFDQGDFAKAAADYVRAYGEDKTLVEAYVGAIQSYQELGIEYRMYECCEELIKNLPDDPTGYLIAANLYAKQNDFAKALEYYLRQVEAVPTVSEGYEKAVRIYYNNNDIETALRYAELMMEQFPELPSGYNYATEFLIMQKKNADALALAEKTVALFPEDTTGYIYIGYLKLESGDVAAAASIADRCPDQNDERVSMLKKMVRGKDVITFSDPSMETAVRTFLGREANDILLEDVFDIRYIEIKGGSSPKVVIEETDVPLDVPVGSLSDLAYFESLASIEIGDLEFPDYSVLSGLTGMLHINFHTTNLDTVDFIKDMSHLITLHVTNSKLTNFSVIEDIVSIQDIDLNQNNIAEIPNLSQLARLKVLTLNNNSLFDLANLSGAKQLESLYLAGNSEITDVSPLKSLEKLTTLSLSGCSVTDYSPVDHVENLTK